MTRFEAFYENRRIISDAISAFRLERQTLPFIGWMPFVEK
jgi:hypothetical protein